MDTNRLRTTCAFSTCTGLVLAALITGCAPAPASVPETETEPATVEAQQAAAPTEIAATPDVATEAAAAAESAILVPTAAPDAAAPVEAEAPAPQVDWVNTVTVEGDYYIRGNPAAPVRLIDYSDFL